MSDAPRLVLASGSPRRKDLLARLTPVDEVINSGAEENPWDLPSRDFPAIALPPPHHVPADANPMLWAWRKAQAVVPQATMGRADALILGADTIVVIEGDALGKPRDAAHAGAMLRRLAGREHAVVTGWAFVLAGHNAAGERTVDTVRYDYVSSLVEMRDYDDAAIAAYVATGEPMDKAGAYAIQGEGGGLVRRVTGCYSNVVGLPLCAVRAALAGLGWPANGDEAWHDGCAGPYCNRAGEL
jgi:septum formation protein